MWIYTNAGRIRPVLEGSLLFLFVILFLLALSRQKLLSSAGLGEGGGHELTDVSSLCLDQLLCRRYMNTKTQKLSRRTSDNINYDKEYNRVHTQWSVDLKTDQMTVNGSLAYGYHCAAPQPR